MNHLTQKSERRKQLDKLIHEILEWQPKHNEFCFTIIFHLFLSGQNFVLFFWETVSRKILRSVEKQSEWMKKTYYAKKEHESTQLLRKQ